MSNNQLLFVPVFGLWFHRSLFPLLSPTAPWSVEIKWSQVWRHFSPRKAESMFEIPVQISKTAVRTMLSCCSEIRENCPWGAKVSKIKISLLFLITWTILKTLLLFFFTYSNNHHARHLASLDSVCCVFPTPLTGPWGSGGCLLQMNV